MYIGTIITNIGEHVSTYEFNTSKEVNAFIEETDKTRKRYSCFESSGKFYALYYVENN